MRRLVTLTALALVVPALAAAHVGVRPRESKAGADEKYTVRVPTEGKVATTSVELEIPAGVTVLEVMKIETATFDIKKDGTRITSITWTKEIPPGQSAEFVFHARNPAEGTSIVWKSHQHYADGTASHWVNAPGERQPAPVTKLIGATEGQPPAASGEAAKIETWLAGYDAAFNAKDLERLAAFYHQDVTIYEGGGVNNGWADYRDHHLGPELKEFQNLQFAHTGRKVHVLGDGRSAYSISQYSLKAKMGERDIDSGGLETLVLIKGDDGAWKIRHSHTSSRARRPPQTPDPAR